MLKRLFATPSDQTLAASALALRIVLGLVILPHGAQKLLGWFGGFGFQGTMDFFTQTMQIPAPLALLVIIAEFFGPLALFLGLLTRPAAAGIAVVMVVAALTSHLGNGFFMNWYGTQPGEGFEFHLLAAGIGLALVITGGGAWSLDSLLAKTTRPEPIAQTSSYGAAD
ncbi:MAG: DoxX family protein [Roseiflexaceae bacterium]